MSVYTTTLIYIVYKPCYENIEFFSRKEDYIRRWRDSGKNNCDCLCFLRTLCNLPNNQLSKLAEKGRRETNRKIVKEKKKEQTMSLAPFQDLLLQQAFQLPQSAEEIVPDGSVVQGQETVPHF
ncbi:hypothetical protein CDAR_519171 [Caerostris darwini]|uniref:Uncharacterized protein n=1 Tax=Caerostris darwini TaxID=1538125 RepID=A0AAV4PYR4_9ARAC|nr:hypothetical protein CDAR_519171 [Caerostris darwini]